MLFDIVFVIYLVFPKLITSESDHVMEFNDYPGNYNS